MENLVFLSDGVLQAWRNLPLGTVERSLARALIIGICLFFVIYLLERFYGSPRDQYASRSFWHDVAYWFYYRTGLHHFLFLAALFGALAEPLSVFNLHLLAPLPFALQAILYMAVADFFAYWIHRAQHHFRFLWVFHTTHHSQEHLNFVTSQRVHPIDHLVQDIMIYVPLRIMGFDEAAWIPMYVLGEFHLAAQHSRIPWRFGAFYKVIVSPVFHSYHHSIDPAHHNKNFAGIFSFWDYVFGTAVKDNGLGPSRFGLENVASTTLASTLAAPFRLLSEFYFMKARREP